MRLTYPLVVYLAVIAVAALFWTQTTGLLYPAGVFPRILLVLVVFCAIALLVQEVVHPSPTRVLNARFFFSVAVAASVAVYIWSIGVVGYYISTIAYLLILYPLTITIKEGRSIGWGTLGSVVLVTSGVTLFLYVVFTVLLRVNVPKLLSNGPI